MDLRVVRGVSYRFTYSSNWGVRSMNVTKGKWTVIGVSLLPTRSGVVVLVVVLRVWFVTNGVLLRFVCLKTSPVRLWPLSTRPLCYGPWYFGVLHASPGFGSFIWHILKVELRIRRPEDFSDLHYKTHTSK